MHTLAAIAALATAAPALAQSIADLTSWTLVEDPPNQFFRLDARTPGSAALAADDASDSPSGNIPAGADLGLQSINANTAAESTAGFAFARTASFAVAIDYTAVFNNAATGLGFGFGIGIDGTGDNSAGVAFVTQAGLPAAIPFAGPAGGAARVNNVTTPGLLTPAVSSNASSLAGSFHAAYDATTGNITIGVGPAGAGAPVSAVAFNGASVAGAWPDGPLLASFFIRSDTVTVPIFGTQATPWTSGEALVTFSNLRVVQGAAFDLACLADFDNNGAVDHNDITAVLDAIDNASPSADLDSDGSIDFFDLIDFLIAYDAGCP